MNDMKATEFQGQQYYDDRSFVLYLCKAVIETALDGVVTTTIYHDQAPNDSIWCVLTYKLFNIF